MKKIILAVIVVLACVVNAQTLPTGTEWVSSSGRKNEKRDVVYQATNGSVQFTYSWGGVDKNPNQMWTYERIDDNTGWKYKGGTFEFTSDYVWTDFNTKLDERNGNPGTIVEYGYYTTDADGRATSDLIPLISKDADGNTVEKSVVFEKDDKIGVYLKVDEGKGKTVTLTSSDSKIQGTSAASPNVDTQSRGKETQYFCLFDNRKANTGIGNYSHFEYYFGGLLASESGQSYEDFIEQVIETDGGNTNITDINGNPVTTGQPLPGTMATLLIGSLCAAGLRKKNKKH
ncbi:MAG: hypothetical protein IKZ46_07665 [Victivallales bacterium]|nr:hypothetical protein [Victivallales bacterium]